QRVIGISDLSSIVSKSSLKRGSSSVSERMLYYEKPVMISREQLGDISTGRGRLCFQIYSTRGKRVLVQNTKTIGIGKILEKKKNG
ncbi:hypothetical protein, partial [Microcystis sp. T1-4]|uniref:hypothetical protein n=1 Tax=Microcystis sp. T1-4 TaxID=1160279 RepID=UPI00058782BB